MFISKQKYLLFDKHFIVLTLLVLGVVASVSVVSQKTQTQQQASEAVNLNSASEIDSTINPDRTMGPGTSQGNFSNLLPSAYLGRAVISVQGSNDSPEATNLELTISKAEVHLVRLFVPGTSNDATTEGINGRRTNQNVSKWETLQLNGKSDAPAVLKLEKGLTSPLGDTNIAGGKYAEIRLYVSKARAELLSGTEIDLVIPGGGDIIRVARPFNIFASNTTSLILNLDIKNSIIKQGEIYVLKPVISGFSLSD